MATEGEGQTAAASEAAGDEAQAAALRERLQLKREVLDEIEKEYLLQEVLSKLKPAEGRLRSLIQHPAFLLFLGFTLTTVVGTIITSYWQYTQWTKQQDLLDKQWIAQQDYLYEQKKSESLRLAGESKIRQKNTIKEDALKLIAATSTAAEDILASFEWSPNDQRHPKESDERAAYWQEASRNWRIQSKLIRENLSKFTEPRIAELFKEITNLRSDVGNSIQVKRVQHAASRRRASLQQAFLDSVDDDNMKISKMVQLGKEMREKMDDEINAEEKALYYVPPKPTPSPKGRVGA